MRDFDCLRLPSRPAREAQESKLSLGFSRTQPPLDERGRLGQTCRNQLLDCGVWRSLVRTEDDDAVQRNTRDLSGRRCRRQAREVRNQEARLRERQLMGELVRRIRRVGGSVMENGL